MSKSLAQRMHAKKRFKERLGIELNRESYKKLCRLIQQSGGRYCIGRQSNRISIHRINYQDKPVRIIYDRLRSNIITVLYDNNPAAN